MSSKKKKKEIERNGFFSQPVIQKKMYYIVLFLEKIDQITITLQLLLIYATWVATSNGKFIQLFIVFPTFGEETSSIKTDTN